MSKKWFWLVSFILLLSLGGTASAELMVHWRLDEGSGTTVYDSSGNGCDGTFNGEPQWVAGYLSAGALQFDGADDFVVYSMPETQDLDAFTIALWVKAETLEQPSQYCSPFTGHYPNSDGFQYTPAASHSWVIAQAPTSAPSYDFDLIAYTDYVGSTSGFSNELARSEMGGNATDFIVGHFTMGLSDVYPAVIHRYT